MSKSIHLLSLSLVRSLPCTISQNITSTLGEVSSFHTHHSIDGSLYLLVATYTTPVVCFAAEVAGVCWDKEHACVVEVSLSLLGGEEEEGSNIIARRGTMTLDVQAGKMVLEVP
ncbi:hypothetical protein DM860_001510 [Cuscuta australis]|uniref:Uncharacterized protein n=1 Tax=Cuscuta australis TaxID=267555 RepID=A0A328E8Z2_9ASTE|nr:hypothetical protein DM860_001510 [Cuscuta australis]